MGGAKRPRRLRYLPSVQASTLGECCPRARRGFGVRPIQRSSRFSNAIVSATWELARTGARRAWRQSHWCRRLQPTVGRRRACTALSIPRLIAHQTALRPKTEVAHYALIELAKAPLNAKLHAVARATVRSLGAQEGHSPPGLALGPIKDLVECRTALDAPDPCAPLDLCLICEEPGVRTIRQSDQFVNTGLILTHLFTRGIAHGTRWD